MFIYMLIIIIYTFQESQPATVSQNNMFVLPEMKPGVAEAYKLVQDALGDPSSWGPWRQEFLDGFLDPALHYRSRFKVIPFCLVNGIPKVIFESFFAAMRPDAKKLKSIVIAYQDYSKRAKDNPRSLYSWDVRAQTFTFMDGTKRGKYAS